VGSAEVTVEAMGFMEVFVIRVVDSSVTVGSLSSPPSYDLRGIRGSVFPLSVSAVLSTGIPLLDVSLLVFGVTIQPPQASLMVDEGLVVRILGNSRGVSVVRVDLPACGLVGVQSVSSSLEAHIIANAIPPFILADVEVRFDGGGDTFTLTMFSTVPVLAFFIHIQTDSASLGVCTPLDAMPHLSDCSENSPGAGMLVVAGVRHAPFPSGRTDLVAVVGADVTVVWGFIEIYTGDSAMRFSIQAGVYGPQVVGVNSSVGMMMQSLPIVDTSVLSRSLGAVIGSPGGGTLRRALFNLLLLVGRQRSVDARVYSNEFELSFMVRVTDRFLVPDTNRTNVRVLFRTDKLPVPSGGVQVGGEGLWVPASHVFDGWYTVEFQQKIPVMRLGVSYSVSTSTSRSPWVWDVEGLVDTGAALPACPRSATQTATFLSSYHVSVDVLRGLPSMTQEFVDRLACGMQVASRRVMVSPVDAGGQFTITVALESLNRVHQANFLLMGDFLIDELARRLPVNGGNGSLVGLVERGGLKYINDTSDPPVSCPVGFYFDKNGTYQTLPPHAKAGPDCYDLVCVESYSLMEETQHCIPTPATLDVVWICVMVVLTVIISLAGVVCCVQMALWRTDAISDIVFDPAECPPPAASEQVVEKSGPGEDDEMFGDQDECALYYNTVMADVILDDYSSMMVEGMFSPVDLGSPVVQNHGRCI
jgi:hypothetical protein